MRTRIRRGNSFFGYVVVIVAIILIIQFGLGLDLWSAAKMKIDQGIQIISQRGYQISENIKFEQIKAAGIKITREAWDGFLQICDRLVLSLGHLTVYADIEARVMFVYNTSSQPQEAYYVTF
jgi:hypothetical protein